MQRVRRVSSSSATRPMSRLPPRGCTPSALRIFRCWMATSAKWYLSMACTTRIRHFTPRQLGATAHLATAHSYPAATTMPDGLTAECSPRRLFESASCHAHTIAYSSPCAQGYTLSASRAAGGESPLLKVHIGDMHLCTNSAARAAGGETPLLKVQIGDMHLCTNSAARAAGGETPPLDAPWRHAPAQAPLLERPMRAPPACLSPVRSARYSLPVAARPTASA